MKHKKTQLKYPRITHINMRVDRTLYVARKLDPTIGREKVGECMRCQVIYPPLTQKPCDLRVDANWKRIAIDVRFSGSVFSSGVVFPVTSFRSSYTFLLSSL